MDAGAYNTPVDDIDTYYDTEALHILISGSSLEIGV
jgi:hypothetical protein